MNQQSPKSRSRGGDKSRDAASRRGVRSWHAASGHVASGIAIRTVGGARSHRAGTKDALRTRTAAGIGAATITRADAGKGDEPIQERDSGSAVVDFVLVGALLTVIVVAVIQLALVLHVRNTLTDAAASGARYGTLADRNAQDGVERARQLISGSLSPEFAQDISYARTEDAGHTMLKVTVRSPLPVIGLIGPQGGIEVAGHAYWPD